MSEHSPQRHSGASAEVEPIAACEAVTGRGPGRGSEPGAGFVGIPEVGRLLAALRDAAPQPGLEQRVARAVHRRRVVAPVPGALWRVAPDWLVTWSLRAGAFPAYRPRLVVAGALAGVAAFVLAAFLLISTPGPQPPAIARVSAGPSGPVAPVSMSDGMAPRPSTLQQRRTVSDRRVQRSVRSVTVTATDTKRRMPHSYPAPREPLTAEEKALLQLARTGGPAELALLNPEVRARHDAQEAAAFEQFVNSGLKRP